MSMKTRLDAHFVACAAAAGAAIVGAAQNSEAAIVYSGIVNLPINSNFFGLYLNVETGVYVDSVSNAAAPGWDLNPYYGGASMFQNSAGTGTGWVGSPALNLAPGTPITAATNTSTSTTNFVLGQEGIIGFRFADAANVQHFGWAHFTLGSATQAGLIRDYAWESVSGAPINAGAIPAPGSVALLALGALGLTGRRRK